MLWFQKIWRKEVTQSLCNHNRVKILTCEPVTLYPKTGYCKACGQEMEMVMTWESTKDKKPSLFWGRDNQICIESDK